MLNYPNISLNLDPMNVTFANATVFVDQCLVDAIPGILADSSEIAIRNQTIPVIKSIFVDNQHIVTSSHDLYVVKNLLTMWGFNTDDNETFSAVVHSQRYTVSVLSFSLLWKYWKVIPNIIDWAAVFRRSLPTEVMTSILGAENHSFASILEIKTFFHELDFVHLFDENTPETAKLIDKYNKDRVDNCEKYAITLQLDEPVDMMEISQHKLYNGEVLDCKKMSRQSRCEIGAPTMVAAAAAADRFHEYTNGLFLKSPNPEFAGREFDWSNVCVAGGSALKLITPWTTNSELRASDIDVFITGKTFHDRSISFERTLNWFECDDVYFSVRGSVVTIFYKNMPRKIQLISISEKTSFDCICRFDFSHIAVAFVGTRWMWTPTAWNSICTQTTVLGNVHRWNPQRMYKAMVNGYDVAINDKIQGTQMDFKEILDISAESVSQIVADGGAWYYPRDEPDMTPEEERAYHMSCIKKDTNAQAVGRTVETVLKNILIGGSFDSDYAAMLYSNFDIGSLLAKVATKGGNEMLLSSLGGIVRLLTCNCTVTEAVLGDDGFRIILLPSDDTFNVFVEKIEGPVFKIYRQRGVHEHLITNGKFSCEMPAFKINSARNNGIALARTQRGESVDLSEIVIGDIVQMVFNIKFVLSGVLRVHLMPIRFIKHSEYTAEQFNEVEPATIDDQTVEASPVGEIEW